VVVVEGMVVEGMAPNGLGALSVVVVSVGSGRHDVVHTHRFIIAVVVVLLDRIEDEFEYRHGLAR
jgi:hypothetical protein